MTSFEVTTLVENTAGGRGRLAEHGLSFWIELGGRQVLFDAGQTAIVRRNAEQLGINLSSADAIILSHGHYDHVGGLAAVLEQVGSKRILTHPDALTGKYARNDDGSARDIGMPAHIRTVVREAGNVVYTTEPTAVFDGLFVTGPIPRLVDFEQNGGAFFSDPDCNNPDDLVDDQAAFIDTPRGIVVITGCAHAGIINTLEYVRSLVPTRPFCAVIGGMHLVNADEARVDQTVKGLHGFDIGHLYPLHCTGFPATARLWSDFPGRVSTCPVGTRVRFETKGEER
jgi:7,8-dihydropterin-6-yl-methyl-4-(beta-D-ribofuranosyl)aminobenzene 5'-phosphate synthase